METSQLHLGAKCGLNVSDDGTFACHPHAKEPTGPRREAKTQSYKCSLCEEVFSKAASLKQHFKVLHIQQLKPKGPFTCTEQGCQTSSSTLEDHQTHMTSMHSCTLIPCTFQSCRASVLTQEEMEIHRQCHTPYGCFDCRFVTHSSKNLQDHLVEHRESLTQDDGGKDELGRDAKHEKSADEDAETLPSKGTSNSLGEGGEQVYRTHTCPKCQRCFKMRSHLQEHLNVHFPNPSLQCPTCKRHFTSPSKLRLHRLREAGHKAHRCPFCEYSAVERNAVHRHLARVHADEAEGGVECHSFPCPTCGQRFHQSRSLKAHMKTHVVPSDHRPAACFQDGCSFKSPVLKALLKHAWEAHGIKAVKCRHYACAAIFPCEADMEAHRRTHLAYHCSHCSFSSSNKTLFLQHQRLGHAGDKELQCSFCPFVTFNPVELEQHLERLHANENIHRCSQCSYVTPHKRGLKRHMLMHSGEKPYKCSQCDFRCRDVSYLSKHMVTHSDNKNFMCSECGYVTKWKHYLNVHMRKHNGDLRYQCDQCPYRCHRMDQLKSHKLRHQTKSLICEICAYACKRKYELRNHMLAKHSENGKQGCVYQCKYCTYTSYYRQALQNHENCKHTKLKEFHCALCSYSSFSSVSLFLHKRKAHGYIPGDKAWLDNYAAKEKEGDSTKFVHDFYKKSNQQSSTTMVARSQGNQVGFPAEAVSQTLDNTNVYGPVPAEVVSGGISDGAPSVDSAEEYCTLVLTTLSASDYPAPSSPSGGSGSACQTPALTSKSADTTHDNVVLSSAATWEEDDGTTTDGEFEQNELEGDSEVLNNASESAKSEGGNDLGLVSQSISDETQLSKRKICMEDMKKHNRDQAEAMVLEGRVHMLVVPTDDAHTCEKSTVEKGALGHQRQSLCQQEYKCQRCGAQFKQKRGFDSHIAKKCPILVPEMKTREEQHTQSLDQSVRVIQIADAHQTDAKVLAGNAATPRSKTQTRSKCQKSLPSCQKYTKFTCKYCSFSSIRQATVNRHISKCRKRRNRGLSEMEDQDGEKQVLLEEGLTEEHRGGPVEPPQKIRTFSCPRCSFKCSLRRALDSHRRRGCLKSRQAKLLHCKLCTFSCKQERRLVQHVALKHDGARPHRCRFCAFSTTRRYRLDEHESLHTGIGRHSCTACDKTFGTVSKLRQHKMRIHDKLPTHFCSLCDFSGYTLDDVRRHNLRCHTGELQHACTPCEAHFNSELALRNHCKRVHQLQACHSCPHCDYTCSSEATLKVHQHTKHRQLRCSTCQEPFETKELLDVHQKTHLPRQCPLCSFATKTKRVLAQHLLSQHEEGPSEENPLKCSSCTFTCRHQLVFEHHLRSHGGKRLYRCTDCQYSTQNKQKMVLHFRIHTGEKPYSCDQCSYTCTEPTRLKLHMRVHQEEKKYLCPDCGYKCKWATQLKYHMTKHTGEKRYICDQCEYRTNRADALRVHKDTQHCDARSYICEKCGKAFKTRFVLKTHQRQHTDDRPYTCGCCHKAFRWPAGLRYHYLTHTKQQPFRCLHCPYKAKQKFQVVKHLQKHHPEAPVEQSIVRDTEAASLTLKEALRGSLDLAIAGMDEETQEGSETEMRLKNKSTS